MSWDGWEPRAGMVGYVIHIWRPNHPNKMYRTPLNRDVYLIEIGKNYVPVTASGLRQYNQAMDSTQKEIETSRRNSLQREMSELRQLQQQHAERGLTPILGSSLESPTSLLNESTGGGGGGTTERGHSKSKIKAVSSSSSEDESSLLNLEKERQEEYLKNLWQQVIEQEQTIQKEIQNATNATNSTNTNKQLLKETTNTNTVDTTNDLFEENNDKNKTIQINNKQTDNITTAPNKEETQIPQTSNLQRESSKDSNNVSAKELVEQLVDHVVDELCVEAEEEKVKKSSENSPEQQQHVQIIEIKSDDNSDIAEIHEEIDEAGNVSIVYSI